MNKINLEEVDKKWQTFWSKKKYQFNDHSFQISSLFKSNSTNLDKYTNHLKLDVAPDEIQVMEKTQTLPQKKTKKRIGHHRVKT